MKFDMTELNRLARKVKDTPTKTRMLLDEATQDHGRRLLDATVRNASGRPGPNIITGHYRQSFVLEFRDGGAYVSNSDPQAHRLEYGFVGLDSLGREYNQPPFPHFGPAILEVRPLFIADIAKAPFRAWRSS
jgi:hypothetical protein